MSENTSVIVKSTMPVTSIVDLQKIGEFFAQSGMFGIQNAAQGMIVAATCHMRNMDPLQFKETYHIIDGTPSMRADAMLARFQECGGRYKIASRTPDKAAILLDYEGSQMEFALTWEDAQREPFPWAFDKVTKQQVLKKNWATPRARMQMLWARVVSDGVRAICPKVNHGTYTPEEVQDFDGDNSRPAMKNVTPAPVKEQATAPANPTASTPASVAPPPAPTSATATRAAASSPSPAAHSGDGNAVPAPKVEVLPPVNAGDPTTSPIGKNAGKPWSDRVAFPDSALKAALGCAAPAITEAHKQAIRTEIGHRMQADADAAAQQTAKEVGQK